MTDSVQRFSDRVADYVRHRPSYPPGVIATLCTACGLGPQTHVADIGSGTGIFTRLLLPQCARVYAVEPNAAMRTAAEAQTGESRGFVSVTGTAEETTLPDAAVDLVTAAQAFHWFEAVRCRREFVRILRPGGQVALVWNERLLDATPFLGEYEDLLRRRATDYSQVNHLNIGEPQLRAFFGPGGYETATFAYSQHFDFEGLRGRLLSSSYAPNAGQPGHDAMLAELTTVFSRHQQDGQIAFLYATRLYYGRLT